MFIILKIEDHCNQLSKDTRKDKFSTFKNSIFHQVDVKRDHNSLLIFRNQQRLGVAE